MTDQTPSGTAMKPVTAAKKLGIYLPATPQEFQDGAVTHAELRPVGTHAWSSWRQDLKLSYDTVFKQALGLK